MMVKVSTGLRVGDIVRIKKNVQISEWGLSDQMIAWRDQGTKLKVTAVSEDQLGQVIAVIVTDSDKPSSTVTIEPGSLELTAHEIHLAVTEVQAEVLMTILSRVGGHPGKSYRLETDRVQKALLDAGIGKSSKIKEALRGVLHFDEHRNRNIEFKDLPVGAMFTVPPGISRHVKGNGFIVDMDSPTPGAIYYKGHALYTTIAARPVKEVGDDE